MYSKHLHQLAENETSTALTITKVKKPWYAPRKTVVKKMNKSIPEYQAIKGLNEKFYSFTENRDFFGGIYLWESEANAREWFNPAWFERTKKKFKLEGIVDYYQILNTNIIRKPGIGTTNYWSVLSLGANDATIDTASSGLLEIITIQDEATQQKGYISIWENETKARTYFSSGKLSAVYFDTPIHIYHVN